MGTKESDCKTIRTSLFWNQMYTKINSGFLNFCGYDLKWFGSFDNFSKLMFSPRDASSLGITRLLFGLAMLFDIPEERFGSELDFKWGDENQCRFPLFPFVYPLSLPKMGLIYGIMWFGALGICLGYKFKFSCWMFTLTYWYIFLIDKSSWNNHSYLYGLMCLMFTCSSADVAYSLDNYKSRCNGNNKGNVPFWNYFLLKFQFYILYTYAGLKKLTREWLSGYSMTYLGNHWVFTPFRMLLGSTEMTDLLVIHWFGCIFDLTIAFWLTYKPTRRIASVVCASFHLMNLRLFHIGMFPWVCLFCLPLFYNEDWPKKVIGLWRSDPKSPPADSFKRIIPKKGTTRKQKITTSLVIIYCGIQLFLPYSHFITKGYNNWTNGLYGYSWDMMIHAWDTILVSVKVVDKGNGNTLYLDPFAFSDNDRWTKHADMAKQHAECVHKNLLRGIEQTNGQSSISPHNVSIHYDIWCSLNGRFQQRVFNPNTDVLAAEWSPFRETDWVLPLISELTHFRPRILHLTNEVLMWSEYSDVLFIADFPGFHLDNFITKELDNVTLTILEGAVKLKYEDNSQILTLHPNESIVLKKNVFHQLHVTSKTPASYMYTFLNQTSTNETSKKDDDQSLSLYAPFVVIRSEVKERWKKFQLFIGHVANSLLYLVYGVPMPKRVQR